MQTPGRSIEATTPMLSPLGSRMDTASANLIERSEERLRDNGISRGQTRQLGSIILEFERLNTSMRSMRSEIQADLRERKKYYKEEKKILKEDLENTNLFKTAALFDGRKNLALISGAIATKELADGDIGGALQATSAAVGLLLPEIIGTIVTVLGLGGIAGGGRGVPRGNVTGGMRGIPGGKGGIITAALLATALIGKNLFGSGGTADTRRKEGTTETIAGFNTINEPDVNRFKVQLNRFESILDGMMSGPTQIGTQKTGKRNAPAGSLSKSGSQELDSEIGEATEKNNFNKGFGSGELSQQEVEKLSTLSNAQNIEKVETGNETIIPETKPETTEVVAEPTSQIMSNKESKVNNLNSEPKSEVINNKKTIVPEVLSEIEKERADANIKNTELLQSAAILGGSGVTDGKSVSPLANIDFSGTELDKEVDKESLLSKLDPRKLFRQNRKQVEAESSGMSSDDVSVVNNQPEQGSSGGSNLPAPGNGQVQVSVNTAYRVNSGTAIDKFDHNASLNSYTTFRV